MLASTAANAVVINWTGPSDFDNGVTQTFAGVTANHISFSGSAYSHSHFQDVTWGISLTINGTPTSVFSQQLGASSGNFETRLDSLGSIAFASGLVTALTFTCDNCSFNQYHGFYDTNFTLESVASGVPEPSTWAMMLVGFAGLGFAVRRRERVIPA